MIKKKKTIILLKLLKESQESGKWCNTLSRTYSGSIDNFLFILFTYLFFITYIEIYLSQFNENNITRKRTATEQKQTAAEKIEQREKESED